MCIASPLLFKLLEFPKKKKKIVMRKIRLVAKMSISSINIDLH